MICKSHELWTHLANDEIRCGGRCHWCHGTCSKCFPRTVPAVDAQVYRVKQAADRLQAEMNDLLRVLRTNEKAYSQDPYVYGPKEEVQSDSAH